MKIKSKTISTFGYFLVHLLGLLGTESSGSLRYTDLYLIEKVIQ